MTSTTTPSWHTDGDASDSRDHPSGHGWTPRPWAAADVDARPVAHTLPGLQAPAPAPQEAYRPAAAAVHDWSGQAEAPRAVPTHLRAVPERLEHATQALQAHAHQSLMPMVQPHAMVPAAAHPVAAPAPPVAHHFPISRIVPPLSQRDGVAGLLIGLAVLAFPVAGAVAMGAMRNSPKPAATTTATTTPTTATTPAAAGGATGGAVTDPAAGGGNAAGGPGGVMNGMGGAGGPGGTVGAPGTGATPGAGGTGGATGAGGGAATNTAPGAAPGGGASQTRAGATKLAATTPPRTGAPARGAGTTSQHPAIGAGGGATTSTSRPTTPAAAANHAHTSGTTAGGGTSIDPHASQAPAAQQPATQPTTPAPAAAAPAPQAAATACSPKSWSLSTPNGIKFDVHSQGEVDAVNKISPGTQAEPHC